VAVVELTDGGLAGIREGNLEGLDRDSESMSVQAPRV